MEEDIIPLPPRPRTLREAAAELRCSEEHLALLVRQGKIQGKWKLNKRCKLALEIDGASLERYLKEAPR